MVTEKLDFPRMRTKCRVVQNVAMVDRGIPLLDSNDGGFLPLPIHTSRNERLLPPYFKPGNWDVICHKGKSNKEHSKFN
eukprot:scaffold12966_cov64-Cylindrotheca_fusiformis.AAC.1